MDSGYLALISLLLMVVGIVTQFTPLAFIGLFLLIYSIIKSNKEVQVKKKEFENKVKEKMNSLSLKDYFIGLDKGYSIAVKEDDNKVCFISPTLQVKEIHFNDIYEVKLKEDEETIISTSRSSQLGGALVGGAIFGGLGALAGAVTGKKSTENEVKKIQLEIVVNSLTNPIYNVVFLDKSKPLKKDNVLYKEIYDNANHWCKLISVIIKRNELNS